MKPRLLRGSGSHNYNLRYYILAEIPAMVAHYTRILFIIVFDQVLLNK